MTPASLAGAVALPRRAGVGLKLQHAEALLEVAQSGGPAPAFLEIHAENFMGAGGPAHRLLDRLAEHYPLSVHGVGLSIGGEAPLDARHLDRLAGLLARHPAAAFSEHLAWSSHGGAFFNDLLPVAYDRATLSRVCAHVDRVQSTLGRRMLIENPATYVAWRDNDFEEAAFIGEVVRRSGCGLLLDVNNAYVSSVNHRRPLTPYLAALPLAATGEIHLAGFAEERDSDGGRLLIDHHGAPVDAAVWAAYAELIGRLGPLPTLVEWDNQVPGCARLLAEAARAEAILAAAGAPAECAA